MTEFKEGTARYCPFCHRKFNSEEGPSCDCWTCFSCGEMFDRNIDSPANEVLSLCVYCEDERLQMEVRNEPNFNENSSM